MNRQARVVMFGTTDQREIVPVTDWFDFGNVTFFEAVKALALQEAALLEGAIFLNIQTRDEHDPRIPPAVFKVEVKREAKILNPRRCSDKPMPKSFMAKVWEAACRNLSICDE
jgi:hypothetical protein